MSEFINLLLAHTYTSLVQCYLIDPKVQPLTPYIRYKEFIQKLDKLYMLLKIKIIIFYDIVLSTKKLRRIRVFVCSCVCVLLLIISSHSRQ